MSAEQTCRWLGDAIKDSRKSLDFALWAFVFMPEHAHVIIYPKNVTYEIPAILKAIKEPVGRSAVSYLAQHSPEWLPRITRQRGTRTERLFWQSGGGFDRNIWEPRALLSMIDYIHMNAVRRGLVARSIDWRWSSAGWFEGTPTCDLIPDKIPPEWIPLG
jgi:putative transposase